MGKIDMFVDTGDKTCRVTCIMHRQKLRTSPTGHRPEMTENFAFMTSEDLSPINLRLGFGFYDWVPDRRS